jgi:hypothetical protein
MIQHVKLLCNEPKQRATDLGKPVNSSLANTSYPILNPTPTASHCELLTSFHSSTRAVPKPERLNPAVGRAGLKPLYHFSILWSLITVSPKI